MGDEEEEEEEEVEEVRLGYKRLQAQVEGIIESDSDGKLSQLFW